MGITRERLRKFGTQALAISLIGLSSFVKGQWTKDTQAMILELMRDDFEIPEYSCLTKRVLFWKHVFGFLNDHESIVYDPDSFFIFHRFHHPSERDATETKKKNLDLVKKTLSQWHQAPLPEKKFPRSHPLWWVRQQRLAGKDLSLQLKKLRVQKGFKQSIRTWSQRSLRYLPDILVKIKRKKLPKTLAFIPFIESNYNHKAHSRKGAKGLWQIMPQTSQSYYTQDLSGTPEIASEIALEELEKNYRLLKRWPLAITAYNTGRHRLEREIKKNQSHDFCQLLLDPHDPQFGFDGQNFYAELLAVKKVMVGYWAQEMQRERLMSSAQKI